MILLLSLILYVPSLSIGFLSDDYLDIEHGFSLETFTRFEAGGFRPLNVSIWALDAAVYTPQNPQGWHLTNLLFHLLNTGALLMLARSLGIRRRYWLPLGALFLLSPAVIPSIARVSGRTTAVAMLPLLVSLSVHAYWESSGRRNPFRLFAAQFLFLISLLSKETVLLAPFAFASVTVYLDRSCSFNFRQYLRTFLLYLIPVIVYLAWRFLAVGFTLGYSETADFGFFMVRNVLLLLRMIVSPWFDSISARMLLILLGTSILLLRRKWKSLLLGISITVPLLLTVSNLPPRPYYAYAALPGAAICLGIAASFLKSWKWQVLIAVMLTGCFLEARDELGRLRVAADYTESTLHRLEQIVRDHPNMTISVSGIEDAIGGYGTIWPGAYREALLTRGFVHSFPVIKQENLWESLITSMENGDTLDVLMADFSTIPVITDTFKTCARNWDIQPPPEYMITDLEQAFRTIQVDDDIWSYNSCWIYPWDIGPGLLLVENTRVGRYFLLSPVDIRSDTAFFDLENSIEWLVYNRPFTIIVPGSLDDHISILFSSNRLYMDSLRTRIRRKHQGHPVARL